MKAVILAAGFGTRFIPATKSQPKEMMPFMTSLQSSKLLKRSSNKQPMTF